MESARWFQGNAPFLAGAKAEGGPASPSDWTSQLQGYLAANPTNITPGGIADANVVIKPSIPPPSTPPETPPAPPVERDVTYSRFASMEWCYGGPATSWDTTHNATTGYTQIPDRNAGSFLPLAFAKSGYTILRTCLLCVLDDIPMGANIISASYKFYLYNSDSAGKQICLQQAYAAIWDNAQDYFAFRGTPMVLTTKTFDGNDPANNAHSFDLDASSILYLEANIGGMAVFMLREYAHDYANVAPTGSNQYSITALGLDSGRRPEFTIHYTI